VTWTFLSTEIGTVQPVASLSFNVLVQHKTNKMINMSISIELPIVDGPLLMVDFHCQCPCTVRSSTKCSFILSGAYLLRNAVSYDGEILQADAYRPCAKHPMGFMSKGVVVTKKMTFLNEISACRPTVAVVTAADGSVGWLDGQPWPRPVLLRALLLIAPAV